MKVKLSFWPGKSFHIDSRLAVLLHMTMIFIGTTTLTFLVLTSPWWLVVACVGSLLIAFIIARNNQ